MQRYFLLSALSLNLLLLSGCRKDPPLPVPVVPVLHLKVEPQWGGQPFDKTAILPNGAGQRVQVQQLQFYLSSFTLLGGGDSLRVFDSDLFGLVNGPVHRYYTVTGPWTFDRLRFGLGLPPAINHTDITTWPVDHHLGNNSGMYWSWATLYRFSLFDGRFDNDVQATGPLPFQFSIHTGLDILYRTVDLPLAALPALTDTLHLTVVVDVRKYFGNGVEQLDLSQGSQWHGTVEDLHLGILAADLQRDAFSVQWAPGH